MISQCRHDECTDFSTRDSRLCDTHHQEHADRCEKLAKRDAGESLPKLNTQGAEACAESVEGIV